MAKMFKTLRWCANAILCVGLIGVVNESDTFIPNFIGLGCFIILIIINKDKANGHERAN